MMDKNESKRKQRDTFILTIEKLRNELTDKFSDISSSRDMDTETVKLLKEITSIIKELDKLIKEDTPTNNDEVYQKRDKIYELMKEKSVIDN